MNYYSPNVSEIGKTKNIYGSMKSNTNVNRKPITANEYNLNHIYNQNNQKNLNMNMNNDNI